MVLYPLSVFCDVAAKKIVINSSDIGKLRFLCGLVLFKVPNKHKKFRKKIRPLGPLLSFFKNLWIQGKKGTFSTNLKMAYQSYIGGGICWAGGRAGARPREGLLGWAAGLRFSVLKLGNRSK